MKQRPRRPARSLPRPALTSVADVAAIRWRGDQDSQHLPGEHLRGRNIDKLGTRTADKLLKAGLKKPSPDWSTWTRRSRCASPSCRWLDRPRPRQRPRHPRAARSPTASTHPGRRADRLEATRRATEQYDVWLRARPSRSRARPADPRNPDGIPSPKAGAWCDSRRDREPDRGARADARSTASTGGSGPSRSSAQPEDVSS